MIKTRRMKWVRHIVHMNNPILVEKPDGKRAFVTSMNRCEDNIKINLKE